MRYFTPFSSFCIIIPLLLALAEVEFPLVNAIWEFFVDDELASPIFQVTNEQLVDSVNGVFMGSHAIDLIELPDVE